MLTHFFHLFWCEVRIAGTNNLRNKNLVYIFGSSRAAYSSYSHVILKYGGNQVVKLLLYNHLGLSR